MIKRLFLSKYTKEIQELNSRIKVYEELIETDPSYSELIKIYNDRMEYLKSKMAGKEKLTATVKNFLLPALIILLIVSIVISRQTIIGYVVEQNAVKFSIGINQTFSGPGTYLLDIGDKWVLTSLKISGNVIGQGSVSVYLAKDGINYTVLDSNILKESGIPTITGFAVKDGKSKDGRIKEKNESLEIPITETPIINLSLQNATINQPVITTALNDTLDMPQPINKSISIKLQYKGDSAYDEDNDGIENISKAIDLTAEHSEFNWNADKGKLCTKWEVYSINEDKATTVCYGSDECCSLISLKSSRGNWSEPFYSVYGQNGVGQSNIISAQVIYANYSLDIGSLYADIAYSEWASLSTAYNYEKIVFNEICKDTCILENFNESFYTLIFDIENGTLQLDEIMYSLLPKTEKYTLKVRHNGNDEIGKLSIYKDNNLVISQEKPEVELDSGVYDADVVLIDKFIERVVLESIEVKSDIEKNIIINEIKNNISLEGADIKKKYEIDSRDTGKAVLIATASADSLFKCEEWNHELEVCLGKWDKIRDLNLGEQYNFTISNAYIGFIEGDINAAISANATQLVLINEFPNITVTKNNKITLNLSSYLSNIDSNTIFTYYTNNMSILFEKEIAAIIPYQDFIGNVHTYIIANKSGSIAVSNVFSINVTDAVIETLPANITLISLTDPLVLQKLRNYVDLNLKPALRYNTIFFNGYEIKNDVVVIHITYDNNKEMKWLTSLRNFNEVTESK